jgi:DNA replication protein DnaC
MIDVATLQPYSVRQQIKSAMFSMTHIGKQFSDLKPYKSNALEIVSNWVDDVIAGNVIEAQGSPKCGVGLLLVGKPGHGKTTLACAAAQEIIVRATSATWKTKGAPFKPVYFTDYPRLLRLQKSSWSDKTGEEEGFIEEIYGQGTDPVKLLILDDLGKEYRTSSGYAENTFDALLRSRYNFGLPTIVTTNVPVNDWSEVYGDSMYSFLHEAFITHHVVSQEGDRRI